MLVRARNAPLHVYFAAPPQKYYPSSPRTSSTFAGSGFRGLSLSVFQGVLEIRALEAPVLEHLELAVSVGLPCHLLSIW